MFQLIATILTVLQLIIIADALMSWFMPPDRFPRSLTNSITMPLYAPIRAIIRPESLGGFDISPLIMLFLLRAMEKMLAGALLH
jgi:YggT family protein